MHICDMFDEIFIMDSRGPVKSFFKYLNLYHFFYVTFHFWKFYGVLGNGLSPGPEKVAHNDQELKSKLWKKLKIESVQNHFQHERSDSPQ